MRGRHLLALTVVLAAAVVGAWGYVAFEQLLRYGTCYDIQGDPDTVRACDAYARHITVALEVAVVMSGASFAILLSFLVVFLRAPVRK
jgi:hypothetical protein